MQSNHLKNPAHPKGQSGFSFSGAKVGVGLRRPYLPLFLKPNPPQGIDFVEVISENYMPWEDEIPHGSTDRLLKVRENLPVALHGVSLNLGSTDALDRLYLKRLRNLCNQVDPLWVSDHLCFTGVHGRNTHDLLPLPFTRETLKHLCSRIQKVQDFLKRPILIENVSSYVTYVKNDFTEWEFIAELIDRSGCKLLLDVNNIFVSAQNHEFDPITFLKAIPKHAIAQIHLAGHIVSTTEQGIRVRIDTHDQMVCDEVWSLYRWVCQHLGAFPTMIERDANFPPWRELVRELKMIKEIQANGS